MVRSRVFVFLAIVLFFPGCLCAEAEPAADAPADINKAKNAVAELEELTGIVLGHAEAKLAKAEGTKSTVEDQKKKADKAVSDAKKAAQTITATERKTEADAAAGKATVELAKCLQLYNAAKAKAEGVSKSINALVTRAKTLVESAKIPITPSATPPNDYSKVIQSAATVTGQTTTLSGDINASTLLADSDDALSQLRDSAKKIEVFKYQAASIAIVSRIETALKAAETDIRSIEGKKVEINIIVKEIQTKCEGGPDTSKSSLSQLCTTAESQLQTATTKLQEAQQCSKDMKVRKTQLDATLATLVTLKDTTEEDQAKGEVANVKGHKDFIDGELQKITEALGEVKNALSSAKDVQQQMLDALEKTSEQPVDANLDSTEQTKSTQLTDNEKQNPKDEKSELLNKDKLRKITKDITNNPLIGGEVPTRSAANDTAVTVFIPLLVILVISAVLH